MNKDKALKLALKSLQTFQLKGFAAKTPSDVLDCVDAINAIKESLAQQPDIKQNLTTEQPSQPQQSCYCPNCEALGKELAALKVQPQQEPVAKVIGKFLTRKDELRTCIEPELPLGTSLYTSPPQRTWIGLTEEDKQIAFDSTQEGGGFWEFADAIEAKLKEKNT